MNHAYRLVWSAARGAYVIAPETARGRGKSGGTVLAGALVALFGLALHGAAQAQQAPAAPNVVPTSAATQAYVSPNGVTVVNIGAANAAGVSHNKFHRYDVDARGMVLNNNANRNVAAMESQLAGQVYTNTLLGREAGVILNEVVSPNRSVLAGFTEVLGKKADVIVANPYGITCTGCGFINTDRASLVTGTPVWKADGRVAGFDVAGGDVLINGSGLNASSQALLDIVTRTLKVEGQVNANDVVLATGANAWNYESRQVTGSIAPSGAKKEYAIDTSALGGMYANRIHMIATEAGVGVRMLGEAAARADDFRLDAAGQVVLGGALSAERDLIVRASQLAASGNADTVRFAGRNIDIHTGGSAQFDGGAWAARGAIDAQAGAFTAGGGVQFHSGADAAASDRAMRIKADGTVALNGARLVSSAGMALAAGSDMTIGSGASAEAGGDIAVTARGTLSNDGSLIAARGLSVNVSSAPGSQTTPAFFNRGLLQATGASLAIGEAGQPFLLDNSGKLLGGSVDLYAARLYNKGWIQSDTAFSAQAGEIINAREAVMLGKGDGYRFNLSGLLLSNDGRIQSAGGIDIAMDAEQWLATGMFDSNFALNARRIENRGTIAAAGVAGFKSAKAFTNDGQIDGNGITFITSALKNQGTIHSSASLLVAPGQGTTVSNDANGRIVAEEKLVINGAGIVNHGLLQAGDSLEANLSGGLVNSATGNVLASRGDLLLRAYFLNNVGAMQAARSLRATVTDTLDNQGSLKTIGGNGTLALEGASVSNQGTIEAANTALITSTGIDKDSIISNSGLMQSQGDLVLDSAVAIDNTSANSRILSEKSVLIESRRGNTHVSNYGRIQAAEALAIGDSQARAGKLGNHVSGIMLAKRFTVMADRLENAGAISADSAYIGTSSLFNKGQASSIVSGAGGIDFVVAGMLENQGALHSNGEMRIRAGGIANHSTGGISALGPLALISSGSDIRNEGALYSAGLLTLNALGQTVNNSGSMGASDIAIDAANVTNTNSIVAANNADIRASREFHNLPVGGLPNLVETSSLLSEQVEIRQGGSLLDPTTITVNKYTDTITSSLPGGATVAPGQILAGNALKITYGGSAENIASILSANALTIIAGKDAQSFVNSSLQGTRTDQVSYVKVVMHAGGINTPPWAEYYYPLTQREASAGESAYTGVTRSFAIARERAQGLATSVLSSQGPEYRASIQAKTITFDGGKLVSSGDPLAANPGKRSADGAAAENIAWKPNQSGVVLPSVDKALAISFAGLDLSLPGNPNGYFIVARDPAARYLVETNPLFGMAGGIDSRTGQVVNAREGIVSGSDYLAMELGFDPERLQKRLGDGAYEQRLIQQQLIAQTGRHLLAGARDEAAQMQDLFKGAAGQAGTLGLRLGVALDAGQINALERDMVWMVEQEVRGEKVLAPVVYLSRASREGIERGTVIAADDIVMNVAALDNRGGGIAARDSLTVRSKDTVRNTSGVIKGGSVDLQSAEGDIVNATLAETSADKYRTRTVIGRTATIESSGDMRVEAGRDVVVKGGQVHAGGDATLHAGRAVEVNTVVDRRADASSFSVGSITGLDRQGRSSSTASETHRGSSIKAGGALDASSGGDMRIAGSRVHADGDLLLKAGAGLAVTGRDDTSSSKDSVTTSSSGIDGALSRTQTVATEKSRSRNLESAVSSGGKAVVVADRDVFIKGSSLAADGKLIVAGDAVTVEAGRDIDRSSTTVNTVSLLKADASGKATAVASADGRANVIDQSRVEALKMVDGELVQDVSGGAGAKNSVSVSSNRSDWISVETNEKGKFSGYTTAGATDSRVALNEKSGKGEQPVSVRPARGADARKSSGEASSRSSAEASASGNATASASASGKAGVKFVENIVETNAEDYERLARSRLSGSDVNLLARQDVMLEAATVRAARDLKLQGKNVKIESGQDKTVFSTSRQVTAAGVLVDSTNTADARASGSAKADAKVSHLARPQGHDGDANASVSADASVNAAAKSDNKVDLFRGTGTTEVITFATQTGSDIEAGRRLAVTAGDALLVQGSQLKGKGAVDLDASRMDFSAAENVVTRSTSATVIGAGLALKAEGNAQANAKASVSVEAGGKLADRGLLDRDSAQASVASAATASASASADARGDAGLQFQYRTTTKEGRSTTAKVSRIVSEGGDVSRTAAGEIRDAGTVIDAAGNFSQRASSVNSMAARNTSTEHVKSEDHEGRLGAYAKAGAGVAATASAKGTAGVGYLGGNALDGKAESDAVKGTRAGASAGVELQYGFAAQDKQNASGTAVASSIKAGGAVSSVSTAATAFEGTQISAGKDVDLAAQRMELKAAVSTDSLNDQKTSASGKISAGAGVGTSSAVEGGLEGKLDMAGKVTDSAKAKVVSIAAGKGLSVRTSEDLLLEGASLKAGGDAELKAGGKLVYSAAADTKSSTVSGTTADLALNAGSNDNDSKAGIKLKGGYEKTVSTESKAVVGKLAAGGNLRIEGAQAATLEGTQISAGGDVEIGSQGKLAVAAARDVSDSTRLKLGGAVELGGKQSENPEKKSSETSSSAGIEAAGEYEKTHTGTARTASVTAGGALRTRSGGDSTFEGTALKAGGRVDMDAGGDLSLRAAQDRYTSTSVDGSLKLGGDIGSQTEPDKKTKEAATNQSKSVKVAVAAAANHVDKTTSKGGSITAGAAGATLSAGGNASLQGTAVKSGGDLGIAAGGDLTIDTARSTTRSAGASVAIGGSNKSNTIKTDKNANAQSVDLAAHSGNKETHGAAKLDASGGVALSSGGKTSLVNAEVKGDAGTGIRAASVEKRTVSNTNTTVNVGVSASRESSAAKKKKADPASAQPFEKAVPTKAAPPSRVKIGERSTKPAKAATPSGIRIGERSAKPAKAVSKDAKAARPRSDAQARPSEMASPSGK